MDGSGGRGRRGLNLQGLRAAYAGGSVTPAEVMADVLGRIAAAGDDAVWISRFPNEMLLAQAQGLADPAAPLYGLPFAVKDNIDVAGLPTTAGCQAYAYTPDRHAPVVQRLVDAGAIPVGKTNLDQFATGLVGVRSPFGVPRNPFDPAMPPGGSSSGSAVAVASGLVSFALGTDTAGSGRVPAGFNNLVGLKPTRGWLSTTGVVPACWSLDCVSVFALTVPDALAVAQIAGGFDPADPYSRHPAAAGLAGFRFGVPQQPEFFGDREAEAAYAAAIRRAEGLGGTAVPFDYAPFAEVAALLYGPWAAERSAAVGHMLAHGDAVHPVTRAILESGQAVTGAAVFQAHHRLAELRRQTAPLWQALDLLLLPTTGTAYSLHEIASEPIQRNSDLGHYTNFTNLLDLAAIAVPSGFYADGFPLGITLVGPAWSDAALAGIAQRLHEAAGLPLGATGQRPGWTEIAVFGAHLAGQPLNPALVALGGRLVRPCRTAPEYRMLALPGGVRRPALARGGNGALEGEVWALPSAQLAGFLSSIAPPLGLGTVRLEDGPALGFIAEADAAGPDITAYGGWRTWLASREQ